MKVLFAVSNENISESIVKKYQQEYKEILSYKNVYYFNAILKEIQKDKTYDRIVISEDLEPFANNNYDAIDKFIFEKLDSISDEASNNSGEDIPIILICTDRRAKSDALLVKLFGIGIYSALVGQDRSISEVCNLLNKPRTKKEAKSYYRIDSDDVNYQAESENDVSEMEIQNILTHYKRLGRNEERYVESFDNIASQYTDGQLKIIIKFLPLNVKAVLEAKSPKYQELMTYSKPAWEREKARTSELNNYARKKESKQKIKKDATVNSNRLDIIESNLNKQKLTKPVVIPGTVNPNQVKKVIEVPKKVNAEPVKQELKQEPKNSIDLLDEFEDIIPMPEEKHEEVIEQEPVKKRRGRPRKVVEEKQVEQEPVKKKRGRPRKVVEEKQVEQESVNLFGLADEKDDIKSANNGILPGLNDYEEENDDYYTPNINNNRTSNNLSNTLPGLDDEEEYITPTNYSQTSNSNSTLPGLDDEEDYVNNQPQTTNSYYNQQENTQNSIQNQNYNYAQNNISMDNLLSKDTKVVAFVGTSKNGTSFLVNNLAEIFSGQGIKTAILDLTANNNAYYIYTQNEEALRAKAIGSIENLRRGNPQGIAVNKNLTVYTSLPGDEDASANRNTNNILETLVQNYSIVLLDCDFNTNYSYFVNAQEIYLVQSMDVLTIQPLTAFLRDLKSKNLLDPAKLRIVINKEQKVKSMTPKTIVGGMAFYNDPAMSFMTELFNRETIKYCTVPFDMQTYSKYLEGLVNCKISLNGYSKEMLLALKQLSEIVYPMLSNKKISSKKYGEYNSKQKRGTFSSSMTDTLEQMKRKY